MPKIRNMRRTIALTAAALAATGISLGTAGTAHAAAADCTVINIGSPGTLTISYNNQEIGQVEQQYQVCGGVDETRAHYQWASVFENGNPNAEVYVAAYGSGGGINSSYDAYASQGQNVYSNWVDIHSSNPDTWQASVTLMTDSNCEATGSWHAYANGGNSGGSGNVPCN